uniref:GTP cyclohydrolase II n=1 Tax=Megaviridae environmental sample TaxID=1737588 RepID=A0A5J6VJV2_9VIRU|nr:MAG: GTP cyclohydrolase II [Megaviridae environmental sample]
MWRNIHSDLECNVFCGCYGGDNTVFHALAQARSGVNLAKHHSIKSPDERTPEELSRLIDNIPRKHWEEITTFDPLGLTAKRPTIAAVNAKLALSCMPEITHEYDIPVLKVAIEQAWHINGVSEKCNTSSEGFRKTLDEFGIKNALTRRTLLPAVGGISLFIFGSVDRLLDPNTKVAVRPHDACLNSDCFRGTICTCAPYLMFAIDECKKLADEGGVGIIAYFRKEGRALGEVTKFRVYGARENQAGGDTPEKYFSQTECIAGIRDARHQELMPDVFKWLGITKIDKLLSMSNEKYDAIIDANIQVVERIDLPDEFVPKDATVELTAKVMSGYHKT